VGVRKGRSPGARGVGPQGLSLESGTLPKVEILYLTVVGKVVITA
jgi:hypothetical protein